MGFNLNFPTGISVSSTAVRFLLTLLTRGAYASVNSSCVQRPPPLPRDTAGHLPALSGGAFANFALPGGWAFANPRGRSRAFDTHAVSYQNINTQRVLLEKKQIGSSVKDRNKLKRVVKFYTCISSLLIKPKLHNEIGAIDGNQRFLVIESNFCSYHLKNILSNL